ncbi:hypothetical protein FQA39_LY13792 [Lamprigera yunnana]|nr:hypothetical protein FQA39_LY13792 [Lamprigera yunnana]
MLREKDANPNLVLRDTGISPFHLIIGNESEEFALKTTKLILQCGGNPNVKSDDGLTPLHIASAWGRIRIVDVLLNFGADYEIRDNNYQQPIDYAIEHKHHQVVKLLYDAFHSYIHPEEEKVQFLLTFDKVILSDGETEAEYEVDKSVKVPSSTEKRLQELPQITPTEYVRTWCKQHARIVYNNNVENNMNKAEKKVIFNDFECIHQKQPAVIKSNFVTHRIRKPNVIDDVSLEFETSSKFLSKKKFDFTGNLEEFAKTSYESGVSTLTNTTISIDSLSLTNGIEEKLNNVDFVHKEKNKDTSSDYFTCAEISGSENIVTNSLNVKKEVAVEKLNSLAVNLQNTTINTNNCVSFNAPQLSNLDVRQNLDAVNIAEIYKYTDSVKDIVLMEKRLLVKKNSETDNELISESSKASTLPASFDYDSDTLRKELILRGYPAGPITKTTKRVYLKKLYELKKKLPLRVNAPIDNEPKDPRITINLPNRAEQMKAEEVWKIFLNAIFYIGKGKRSRPYSHLYDAVTFWQSNNFNSGSDKIKLILDIWKDNCGVICLHVFQNVIPVEAYTREAAMINALKKENLKNNKLGQFYGESGTWSTQKQNMLGVLLLYKAMGIFLLEGERQLKPEDID